MKKLVLIIALFVTAGNLAVGVSYAAICQSSKGARACGSSCTANADGSCSCSGTCTQDEKDWVAKKGEDDEDPPIEAELD